VMIRCRPGDVEAECQLQNRPFRPPAHCGTKIVAVCVESRRRSGYYTCVLQGTAAP
jgi:hypothetical protein